MRARPIANLVRQIQMTSRSKNAGPIELAFELEVELERGFDVDLELEIDVEIEVELELALELKVDLELAPELKVELAPTLVVFLFFRGRRQWPQARESADPGGHRGVRGCREVYLRIVLPLRVSGARGLGGFRYAKE